MEICLVNMSSVYKDKQKNLLQIKEHVEFVKRKKIEVNTIIFPELTYTGYILDETTNDFAEEKNGEFVHEIQQIARQHSVNIIAGFIQKNDKNLPFNSVAVVDSQGKLLTTYSKNHLFSQAHEEQYYSSGEGLEVFELNGWKCGAAICMDIRYPRLFESLAYHDVEVIFIPANWVKGENKFEMLRFLTQTRSVENQIYCAMIDRIGKDPSQEYTGSWMIADPLGNDISQTIDEIYHFATLDKTKIGAVRKMIPLRPSFKTTYKLSA